jgi:Tol biopolymer transport system component
MPHTRLQGATTVIKRLAAGLAATATILAIMVFAADAAREQKLQQAINLVESKGDLAKAIPMFEDVARSRDRSLAARALLHLGDAQQRQGADKARATYERIVKEFGSEAETVAAARQRLSALGGGPAGTQFAKRRICSDCGDDEANVSADGRWVVFTDWDSGDLAVRDMSNGQVKRLMMKTGADKGSDSFGETPVFSPDLRQIAYLWCSSGSRCHPQLRVMPNEVGAKSRVLIDNSENEWYDVCAWSPDGKSILAQIYKPEHMRELAQINSSDGTVRVLKSLRWRTYRSTTRASYSPDGRWIVYEARAVNPSTYPPAPSDPADTRIYLLSADGTRESEAVKAAGMNQAPVWTQDGSHILFTSNRTGHWDLWSVPVKDGKAAGPETLVQSEVGKIAAAGIHGGSYYYYGDSTPIEYVNIVDLAPNRNAFGRVARSVDSFIGRRPMWSPDGKSIDFKRYHPGSSYGFDVVVRSLESGDERAYATNLGAVSGGGAALWFHDGKTIGAGFIGDVSYRVDLKTGEFKPMPEHAVSQAAISPDDRTYYFMQQDSNQAKPDQIFAMDMSTGQKKRVFTMPEPGWTWVFLTPDGRTFVGRRGDKKTAATHLFRVNVDGSGYRELYTIAWQDFRDNFTLTKDGRWIVFAKRNKQENWQLWRMPVEGGRPEDMGVELDSSLMERSLDLSPDGSQIAFTASKRTEELWALDNVLAEIK